MLKKADIIFYLLFISFGIYPFTLINDKSSKKFVRIQIGSSFRTFINLDLDTIVQFDTLSALFSVEVKNRNVKMIKSACLNKLCLKQGSINSNSFKSIICLPQKIIIDICSESSNGNIKLETKKKSIFDAVAE